MKEYSCDYRVYTRKIYIVNYVVNLKVQLLHSNALFLYWREDRSSLHLEMRGQVCKLSGILSFFFSFF